MRVKNIKVTCTTITRLSAGCFSYRLKGYQGDKMADGSILSVDLDIVVQTSDPALYKIGEEASFAEVETYTFTEKAT